jgi:hypothetical protein
MPLCERPDPGAPSTLADERDDVRDALTRLVADAFDALPVGVLLADAEGRPLLANRAGRALLGPLARVPLLAWEAQGVFVAADGSPVAAGELPVIQALREGRASSRDVYVVRPDAPPHGVRMEALLLRRRNGAVTAVACSLTEIHGCREPSPAPAAAGDLVVDVTHALNDVLCAIGGYADLIQRSLPAGDLASRQAAAIRRAADRARDETRRLGSSR